MCAEQNKEAPRVTPQDIQDAIVHEYYFTAMDGVLLHYETSPLNAQSERALNSLTFCVLVLKNGFTVTGESSPVSPENFNADIGRRVAREKAIDKLYLLLGFELRTKLWLQQAYGG